MSRGVHAIALGRGGRVVYLGGTFTSVNGSHRQHLAAVTSGKGGRLLRWSPTVRQVGGGCPPRCAPDVHTIWVSPDGDAVYFGGSFAKVNGATRNSAAAVSTHREHVLRWNPSVFSVAQNGSLNEVHDIEFVGKRIVLCGDFYRVNYRRSPIVSPNIVAVDRRRGNAVARFNVAADGAVNVCTYHRAAKRLFVGGHFDHAGPRAKVVNHTASTRHHLAAFVGRRGALDGWSPTANSVPGVFAIAVQKNRLAVGGDFTTINGNQQAGFAQFRVRL
jgi:hypothetical protein